VSGRQQADLIAPLRMGQTTISHRMVGNRWSIVDAVRLAAFFEVEVDDLLDPDRWRPRGPGGRARRDSNPQPSDP
jgi:hypothetical protein